MESLRNSYVIQGKLSELDITEHTSANGKVLNSEPQMMGTSSHPAVPSIDVEVHDIQNTQFGIHSRWKRGHLRP
jgi:hypothetical protein